MVHTDNGVITLAYGAPKYLNMAKTLARSLLLHSPNISRAIVTDQHDDPELLQLFSYIIPYQKEYGSNVRQKLHLDLYSPFKQTVFIDSDCIAVRDISFVFEWFSDKHFSAVGGRSLQAGDKDSFVNVDRVLTHFGLSQLPKFNGGFYYFDDSSTATSVFETARTILKDFQGLGFSEFRGDGPNEEPVLAVAMALYNQTLLQDAGKVMRTPLGLKGRLNIDVLKGQSTFCKGKQVVSPAIVHFPAVWNEHPTYHREAAKLQSSNDGNSISVHPKFYLLVKYQLRIVQYTLKRLTHRSRAIFRAMLN